MKRGLELIIGRDGVRVQVPGGATAQIAGAADLGIALHLFCEREGVRSEQLVIYVAEEMVSHNDLDLPVATPNIKDAVAMQMGMLTPFGPDESFYAFSRRREGEVYRVQLVSCGRSRVEPIIRNLLAVGFRIGGLYPESQRYLTSRAPEGTWALLLPGLIRRIALFEGNRFSQIFLSDSDLAEERIMEITGAASVVSLPDAREELLAAAPLLRQFNMLPREYHQTDYLSIAIKGLAVAVCLVLIVALGGGFYHLHQVKVALAARITALGPEVEKARLLDRKGREFIEFISAMDRVGTNPDLFTLMTRLTALLPADSYLDQLKYDAKREVFLLSGFTEDVAALTSALEKELGQVKLKSTSRRSKKLYFQIEVSR